MSSFFLKWVDLCLEKFCSCTWVFSSLVHKHFLSLFPSCWFPNEGIYLRPTFKVQCSSSHSGMWGAKTPTMEIVFFIPTCHDPRTLLSGAQMMPCCLLLPKIQAFEDLK